MISRCKKSKSWITMMSQTLVTALYKLHIIYRIAYFLKGKYDILWFHNQVLTLVWQPGTRLAGRWAGFAAEFAEISWLSVPFLLFQISVKLLTSNRGVVKNELTTKFKMDLQVKSSNCVTDIYVFSRMFFFVYFGD